MEVSTKSASIRSAATELQKLPPLTQVNRPTVSTAEAAHYLNRRPQTLREWAMTGKVIKPTRCNGRLAWPVSEIKRLLGV